MFLFPQQTLLDDLKRLTGMKSRRGGLGGGGRKCRLDKKSNFLYQSRPPHIEINGLLVHKTNLFS